MADDSTSALKFELGHVLFIDIVGYSKLSINEQSEAVATLNEIVRTCDEVRAAEGDGKLVRLPTGDGMALVFRTTPEAPARCAVEISEALSAHPNVRVRMGIHSGPVNEISDVNERSNITGAGINIAQRVMDCGDAGHILLSKRVAEDLENYREWQTRLHSLGECEVKHGVKVSIVNLYTDAIGNSQVPQKLKRLRWRGASGAKPVSRLPMLIGGAALALVVGVIVWQLRSQAQMHAELEKLRQGITAYPQVDAQVRGSRADTNAAAEQDAVYAQLGKQLGVDASVLREKLPQIAAQLKKAPNAGTYERANASYVAKDYAEAERLALQAAADAQKNSPTDSKSLVAALELAGLAAQRAVEYERAMEHFREAEKLVDRNRDVEEWARLEHDIADLLVAQGKYGDAEKLFRSIIAARSAALGPEHPDTLDTRHRLIYALTRQSKYGEAETEARQVLRAREKILGPEHVDTMVSRYNLAEPLVEEGKYAEAEKLYREVIQQEEKVLGAEHPRTLAARVGLATVLGSEGKNAEAEPLYRDIIKIDSKVYGAETPNTLNARQNLATVLQANHKYPEAEAEYREVIKLDEKLIGSDHPDTLICRNNFAEMLNDESKFSEAEAECRQIIPLEQKALGADNRVTLNTRGNLAVALIAQGKFPEAEKACAQVLELLERVLGIAHPDTLSFATKFANELARQNKREVALSLVNGLVERSRKALGDSDATVTKYTDLLREVQAAR